jgi:hypothetical protein
MLWEQYRFLITTTIQYLTWLIFKHTVFTLGSFMLWARYAHGTWTGPYHFWGLWEHEKRWCGANFLSSSRSFRHHLIISFASSSNICTQTDGQIGVRRTLQGSATLETPQGTPPQPRQQLERHLVNPICNIFSRTLWKILRPENRIRLTDQQAVLTHTSLSLSVLPLFPATNSVLLYLRSANPGYTTPECICTLDHQARRAAADAGRAPAIKKPATWAHVVGYDAL